MDNSTTKTEEHDGRYAVHPPSTVDEESQQDITRIAATQHNISAFKSLGWLDRFLALWILLAMVIGVLLGNFVPETGPALQNGKFVGVSVPIGECLLVIQAPKTV